MADPITLAKAAHTAYKWRRPLMYLAILLIGLIVIVGGAIGAVFEQAWEAVYGVAFKPSIETAVTAYAAANECNFTSDPKVSTAVLVTMAAMTTGTGQPIGGNLGQIDQSGLIFGSYENPLVRLSQAMPNAPVPTLDPMHDVDSAHNIVVDPSALAPNGSTNEMLHLGVNRIPAQWTSVVPDVATHEHGVGFLLISPSQWKDWTNNNPALRATGVNTARLDPWNPYDSFLVMSCHILDMETRLGQTLQNAIVTIGRGVIQVYQWVKGVLDKIYSEAQQVVTILNSNMSLPEKAGALQKLAGQLASDIGATVTALVQQITSIIGSCGVNIACAAPQLVSAFSAVIVKAGINQSIGSQDPGTAYYRLLKANLTSSGSKPIGHYVPGRPIDWGSGCGYVQGFGYTTFEHPHMGIDLACPDGATLYSVVDGTVQFAGGDPANTWDQSTQSCVLSAGMYVNIDTNQGDHIRVRYFHLQAIYVKVGDTVHAGDVIGKEGNSGCSTGSHLHFQVERGGCAIDPTFLVDPAILTGGPELPGDGNVPCTAV